MTEVRLDGPKSVLVLGAGRGQAGLIRAVNNLGHKSVVATLPTTTAPGIAIAGEVAHVDIADPAGVLRLARDLGVDAVATSCADTGVPALGEVCDALGLPGLSAAAAQICADKILMKRALVEAGVRTAEYRTVGDLAGARSALEALGLPVLVKASDLQGSQGIVIVEDEESLETGYQYVAEATGQSEVIVEQFIDGTEFGAQALVQDGRVLFTLLHNDGVHMAKTAVPVMHSVPLAQGAEFQSGAVAEIEKAIHATGLNNCAVNVDLIARGQDVFIIELTGRVGANGLAEMVSEYYGLDYFEVVAKVALGERIDEDWTQHGERPAVVVNMIIAPGLRGVIDAIVVDHTDVPEAEYEVFRKPGDVIEGFRHSGDCIGQITVGAPTLEAAYQRMAVAEQAVNIKMRST